MVECLYCHDMVENLQASRFQHFNGLAYPQGTMGRTWNGALQQPCHGTGTPGGGFNHNVAGFLTKLTFRTPSDGDPRIFSAARFARTAHPNRDMLSSHKRRDVTPLCLRSVLWGSCYRPSKPTRSNICPL